MDVQLLTFIIVGASFALYIAIAIWARAGSTNDFYVAGGGVPPIMNGMATAADWMSAASFISMAGLISFMGYDGAVYLMGWTGRLRLTRLMSCSIPTQIRQIYCTGFHRRPLLLPNSENGCSILCHLRLFYLCSRSNARRRRSIQPFPGS